MRFMLDYPILSEADGGRWLRPESMIELARVAEESGADAIALTDHPAPSRKWLDRGGHETVDPFVGLGFFAAATTRLRLMTYLTVVPYRNPLLLAKSMTSVDVLSGGRATFVLGTGYLRSEFAALGVDYERRNALFDEAIEVIRGLSVTDSFSYDGSGFKAVGQALSPGPVQKPHPPLWLGGNAEVVLDRVARWGQGWAPLQGPPQLFQTTRTRPIGTQAELADLIQDLGDRVEAQGRKRDDLDILASDAAGGSRSAGPEEQLDGIGRLADIGVTWTHFPMARSSFDAALDSVRRFGSEVVAKLR
jgi:probable F420-dependent oxidoreductase